jgi:integrase
MAKRGRHGDGSVYQPKHPGETIPPADRNWYVTWYDKNGVKQRATNREDGTKFVTEREARDYLKLKRADAIRGIEPANGGKSLHYADLRNLLFEHHRLEGTKSVEVLSNGDLSLKGLTELDVYGGFRDKNNDDTYTLTGTRGRKIATITKKDWFENFIVRRYQEGVGRKVIASSAKLLRQALKLGKQDALAKDIFVPKDAHREDCLYIEDFQRLIGNKDNPAFIDKEFHPVLKFLFYQGTRIKEALGIQWNQIDFGTGEYHPHGTSNKTGDASAKPLNPAEVLPMLRKLKGNAAENDCVFQAVRSDGDNPAKRIEKAFRKAMLEMRPVSGLGRNKGPAGPAWNCAQCGTIDRKLAAPKPEEVFAHVCTNRESNVCQEHRVPMMWSYCGPSPHALRASCVVYYLEQGLTEVECMKITGHSDIKVFRRYARLKLENIAKKMGGGINKKNKRAA